VLITVYKEWYQVVKHNYMFDYLIPLFIYYIYHQ